MMACNGACVPRTAEFHLHMWPYHLVDTNKCLPHLDLTLRIIDRPVIPDYPRKWKQHIIWLSMYPQAGESMKSTEINDVGYGHQWNGRCTICQADSPLLNEKLIFWHVRFRTSFHLQVLFIFHLTLCISISFALFHLKSPLHFNPRSAW